MDLQDLIDQAVRKKQDGSIALRLRPDGLLHLLELDPRDAGHRGRRRAILRDLVGADAQLAARLLEALDPQGEQPVLPPHPMVLADVPDRQPFGPGDVEFLRGLEGKSPAQITDDEARTVAELEASAATAGDRQLVARIAGPLRRHVDVERERAQLRATVEASSTPVRWENLDQTILPAVTDRLVEGAVVDLVDKLGAGTPRDALEQVAENTAAAVSDTVRDALRNACQRSAVVRPQRKAEAEQRLQHLALGGDPARPTVPVGDGHAGRRRAQRERAAQPTAADLVNGFSSGSVRA